MIKLKKVNKFGKKDFFWLFICLFSFMLGFFSFQIYLFGKFNVENKRLNSVKIQYSALYNEIEEYELLKNRYELILNDADNLDDSKSSLENKIEDLNKEIKNLEAKIVDINNKIKKIS